MAPADVFARAGVSDYRYSIRGVVSRERLPQGRLPRARAEGRALERARARLRARGGRRELLRDRRALAPLLGRLVPGRIRRAATAPAVEPGYADAIPAAYAGFDRALGEIVAALPKESAVIVASDHGFEARAGLGARLVVRARGRARRGRARPGPRRLRDRGAVRLRDTARAPGAVRGARGAAREARRLPVERRDRGRAPALRRRAPRRRGAPARPRARAPRPRRAVAVARLSRASRSRSSSATTRTPG